MVKNMKIRSLGKIIVVTFLISLLSIVLLVISFNHAQKVKEQQAELKQLGLDLAAASDLLTVRHRVMCSMVNRNILMPTCMK